MSSKQDDLLDELRANRKACHDMIKDLVKFRKTIDTILPSKIDFRNKFIWEEKMKTASRILETELSIRRQIDNSIKTEHDLENKSFSPEGFEGRDYYDALSKMVADGLLEIEGEDEGEENK